MTTPSAGSAATAPAAAVHWPEALLDGLGLGLFMVAAGGFGTLLESPASPVHAAVPDPLLRRALMGVAMGLTAVGLITSPWGQRSGAHLNPAVTLTFLRLGRVRGRDAIAYAAAQFLGGLLGVLAVAAVAGPAFLAPPVSGVVTSPGAAGVAGAFAGELAISFLLMSTVLALGRSPSLGRFTPYAAGALVCLFIVVEAPLSGMSMNPARTLASALPTDRWDALWVYFSAPLLGMLASAEVHCRLSGGSGGCAKLLHRRPCVFCSPVTPPGEST
jgi:aquaporin Z